MIASECPICKKKTKNKIPQFEILEKTQNEKK